MKTTDSSQRLIVIGLVDDEVLSVSCFPAVAELIGRSPEVCYGNSAKSTTEFIHSRETSHGFFHQVHGVSTGTLGKRQSRGRGASGLFPPEAPLHAVHTSSPEHTLSRGVSTVS
ncbi:unnamed protein product [Pleuronectes platessa]|uniref:Uncharacterized protein n=1 Tax=Pleuronectes platessa TaxID=8262 RepID=A0A9N7YES9_PLEPL|nr:unnamed protein product [Pleuronectes platessa]